MRNFSKIGMTLGLAAMAIGAASAQTRRGHERPSHREPINEEEEGLSGDAPSKTGVGRGKDNAITACVAEAKAEGRRFARVAEIHKVDTVRRSGRGWDIRGTLILRSSYRHLSREEYGFRCRADAQGVADVVLDDALIIIN
ncbi:hypothetical protein G4G27_12425 [Sphingomonas sp. So64.6b]|uniref:hypothetical protein n=1 Tax=Sphingomonas sp. So64.6b TaxID=2997354 RepID=UPI0016037CA4|nr:hypothetical protein [Sphingomonas sp. So64.6b]QNA84705.1 hypothetical protein G4G27_12425 [Sphingomonas sp. So64.6b]